MALTPGTRLGVYEVSALLGEGGMGQVYRARDTKLNRDVALKILPDAFASDPDRLARFTREAQTLAALNHPNIAHIHGLEESSAVRALVMELVEGEDLSVHIGRGPMPLADALPIAKQIADALETAHEQGIVHRDLKPANVKVRPDGTVKVLDFGLAKALGPDGSSASPDAMNSPTLTARATQMGLIIGTAAYMAPEQARGKVVDRRADIWAFGVVLYEMLAGRRAFDGDDISITLAGVLKEDVSWQALPADLPQPVRRLLQRCLEKDPRRRLRDIGEARLTLEDPATSVPATTAAAEPAGALAQVPVWRRVLPWTVAAAGLGTAVVAISLWAPWRSEKPVDRPLLRLNLDLPGSTGSHYALSPDGTRIVYLQRGADDVRMLATRLLEESESRILPGTEKAAAPFFSPDGQWVGFYANGKLQKISIRGGAPVPLADAPGAAGASWGEDGFIIAALNVSAPLMRIPEDRGTAAEFMKGNAVGGTGLKEPQHLPGGKAILFANSPAGIYVTDLAAVKPQQLNADATFARYLPTGASTGHIVYVTQGTLFALPFDPATLKPLGPPQPVLNDLAGNFSCSNTGTFLYRIGRAGDQGWPVQWLDASGATRPLLAKPGHYVLPTFSPDPGRFLALINGTGGSGDILIYDWKNDGTVNLTRPGKPATSPVWSPDGQHLAVFTPPNGVDWMRADGAGEAHRILEGKRVMVPSSISPNGRYIALIERNPDTMSDLWVAPLDLSNPDRPAIREPIPFVRNPGNDSGAVFSPNGNWIAYFSDVSGRYEVWVKPFPGPGEARRISTDGGSYPAWSSNGRQLLFGGGPGIQVVDYHVEGAAFVAGKPHTWSNVRKRAVGASRTWGLHPDGNRIAMFPEDAADSQNAGGPRFGFLLNFFDEVRRRAPARK